MHNIRKEVLYDILFPHLLGLPFAKALAREVLTLNLSLNPVYTNFNPNGQLKTHPETKGVGFFPAQ
eukprot:160091-Amorphochlora_amoeboformis.AAC.1